MRPASRAIALLIAAFTVVALRRPEALTRAEFYVEDGQIFFLGTYFGNPVEQLFRSYNGYLHLGPRLIADVSRLPPIAWAPFVSNALALGVVALVAAYIASDRMAARIPDRAFRLALAALVLVLPGSQETLGSMTYVPLYGGIFLLALALSGPPSGRGWMVAEVVAAAIAGASGPFGVIFLPLFVARWMSSRLASDGAILITLGSTAVLQVLTFLIAADRVLGEVSDPASVMIVALLRGVDAALLGGLWSSMFSSLDVAPWVVAAITFVLAGSLVLVSWTTLRRWEFWMAWYVWGALLVVALSTHVEKVALLLGSPYFEQRYFLLPGLIVASITVVGVARARGTSRYLAVLVACVLTLGIVGDFRLFPGPDHSWSTNSGCIGGVAPCRVPVEPTDVWTIRWPGPNGPYDAGPIPR